MKSSINLRKVRNVVVVSDTHCGCQMGLCPPDGAKMDGGGRYSPSRLQLKMWGWWEEFWGDFVPHATSGEPFVVVHNGDVIDGVHHGSTTQFSHNLHDQSECAETILNPVVEKCDGRYYQVRGTEAHVGQSAVEEEILAKSVGATPNEEGQHARWELWLNMYGHLVHFLHHIGTTSSAAHEASAVNAELTSEFTEAARWGDKPPSVIVRSHRHRSIEIRLPITDGYATATVTPAWQLKTPFAFKVAGSRLAPPQIGGLVIRVHKDTNEIFTRTWVRHIERSKEAVI